MVKGEAMPVVWHVDDLKVSHKGPSEVTNFSQYLLKLYRNKLKVYRLKIHSYLRIDLDYSETGVVKFSMIKYQKKVLYKFAEELIGKMATPASDHLFQLIG